MREAHGQRPRPAIAIVTQSLMLDWGAPLFHSGDPKPIIIAPGDSSADALAQAGRVANVLTTGVGTVDLRSALDALSEDGMRHVLCEGGPKLNTRLAAAEAIDELCVTLSPKLAGGGLSGGWLSSGGRWLPSQEVPGESTPADQPFSRLLGLNLVHVLEEDSFLFLRLRPDYKGGSAAP